MPAVGTKKILKAQQLTEGKKIMLDLSVFLHEILETGVSSESFSVKAKTIFSPFSRQKCG